MSEKKENKLYAWKSEPTVFMKDMKNPKDIEVGMNKKAEMDENEFRQEENFDVERKIVENMPPKIDIFRDKQNLIRRADYVFIDKHGRERKGERKSASKGYMLPILNALKRLDEYFESNIILEDGDKIQNTYLDACLACEKYLKKRKNPRSDEGKARRQMVEDFYEQLKWESMRFDEVVSGFKTNKESANEYRTWGDVLAKVRCNEYKNGEDGVTVTVGGSGTSDLYVIEKSGSEKKYFKKNEDVSTGDYALAINEFINMGVDSMRKLKEKNISEEEYNEQKTIAIRREKLLREIFHTLDKIGSDDPYTYVDFGIRLRQIRENDKENGAINWFIVNGSEELSNELTKIRNEYRDLKESLEYSPKDLQIKNKMKESDLTYLNKVFLKIEKDAYSGYIAVNNARISMSNKLTQRNVATARLAKLLGCPELVVKTVMCDISVDDNKMRGILMDDAKGDLVGDIYNGAKKRGKKVKYSAKSLRQLSNLQVFDILCGQVDRNDGNIMYSSHEEGGVVYIDNAVAIDNDMSFGELKYEHIKVLGKKKLNRMINIEVQGRMNIPAIDLDFANRIINLKYEIIDHQMADVLTKEERNALKDRLSGLKKFLRKQIEIERKKARKNKNYVSRIVSGNEDDGFGWDNMRNVLADLSKNKKEMKKIVIEEDSNDDYEEDIRRREKNETDPINNVSYYHSIILKNSN